MSASTGASTSGHQTGAPVAFAMGATAPMWSKCVWVRRIPSIEVPSSFAPARILSASSPGSMISALSEPSRLNRKQFSAIWPTVNMRTSIGSALRLLGLAAAGALRLALGPLLGLLAEEALPHVPVQQVGHRNVEGEPECDGRQQRDERILAHQGEDPDEEDRGESALLGRARPARRLRFASSGLPPALLLGAAARAVLGLGATARATARGAGVDPAALGA